MEDYTNDLEELKKDVASYTNDLGDLKKEIGEGTNDFGDLKKKISRKSDVHLDKESSDRISRIIDMYEKRIVSMLDEKYVSNTKKSDKIADAITAFGGSWKFIIIMSSVLVIWILWNLLPFTPFHFDKAPFILMNLILSFVAAFQAPVIMMSQNRQAARDKSEAVVDFSINYKAEQEIDDIQDRLMVINTEIVEIKNMLKEIKNNK